MRPKDMVLIVVSVAVLGIVFMWGMRNMDKSGDPRVTLSGMLVYGDKSGCGLVKVIMMDKLSCSINNNFCFNHRSLWDKRIRVATMPVACTDYSSMRCASKGDHYQESFRPTQCYTMPEIIKVF